MTSLDREASLLDFEALPVETLILETACIEQARTLARSLQRDSQQWQAYLNALALSAFEQWVREWAPDLQIETGPCSLFSPLYAEVLGAVCGVAVGAFRVCLVPMEGGTSEEMALPRAAIALPPFAAHFYVAIQLFEEEKAAVVRGFLRRDRLLSHLETTSLVADPDWTYPIPQGWLENNPQEMLLYFRRSHPEAIALPAVVPHSLPQPAARQTQLLPLRSRFQSSDLELWEVLTWEQGANLLSHPETLQWFLDPKATTAIQAEQTLQETRQAPVKSQLNVGSWLQDRLDTVAQEMAWILLPAFTLEGSALRSPARDIQGFIEQLEREGCSVPPAARSAYLEFQLAHRALTLYAIVWPWLTPEARSAWTLLLILGAPPGSSQLEGVRIAIADAHAVLLEKTFESNTQRYLYARVGGTLEEKFSVTLTSPEGTSLALPPFVFR